MRAIVRCGAAGAFIVLAGAMVGASLAETTVEAELDSSQVSVDDHVVLTVRLESDSLAGNIPAPRLPPLVNLKVAGGPTTATSFQWINGQTSASKTFTYFLLPLKEGEAVVPPIETEVGGHVYRTKELRLAVTAAGPVVPNQRNQGNQGERGGGEARQSGRVDVLVRAVADKESPYVGEPVLLTYELLTRVPIARVAPEQPPIFAGFLVEDVPVDAERTRHRIVEEGVAYEGFMLARKVLTPTEPGRKEIEACVFRITAESPVSDPLERFFRGNLREVERATGRIALNVRPLPVEGKPSDFSGAVGKFSLKVATDRKEASTGDAVGFTVTIEGVGDLRTSAAPVLPAVQDFRVYDPKVEETSEMLEGMRRTRKSWSYVLMPLAAGSQEIPAVRFSYFDPGEQKYRELSGGPTVLLVRRGLEAAPSAPVALAQREVVPLRGDLHYLEALDTPLREPGPPLYRRGSFYLLLGLPPAASAGLVAVGGWRRGGALHRSRKRRIARAARAGLDRARRAGREGRTEEFYEAVSSAILGSLAQRWEVSQAGLTHDAIAQRLVASGISLDTSQKLLRLLERCDSLRFAPQQSAPGAKEDLLREAREALESVDREAGQAAAAGSASDRGRLATSGSEVAR